MDKIAVVILNYNGKAYLEQFLPTVISCTPEATIYVADNCSTDDSVAFLKAYFPNVKLVINKENGGFAKGYNDALKHIEAEYYVLLNSDIEVTPNWLPPCVELIEKHPNTVAIQPKIRAFHNKEAFEHAGAAGGFLDKDFYPFCQGRIFDSIEMDNGQYDSDREIFWATGACMLIRADKYHEVGGLDEDFFAHMEEIDMCWRLKSRGYEIRYCSGSHVFHVGGGTLNYQNPKKTYLNFRNSLFMIAKNYPGVLFFKMFKRLCMDGIAATLFILKFQFRHFFAVFNSHMAFYGKLGSLMKRRKVEKAAAKQKVLSGTYNKSIVIDCFLKGQKIFSDLDPKDFK